MRYEFDAQRGQSVGSHIKMGGEAFGLSLFVDEVVTERDPPRRKVWKTVGLPRLLVIGAYTMGFEVAPMDKGSHLRVWIEYELDRSMLGQVLGRILGGFYARWCVRRMVNDAVRAFIT